eukprot:scpid107601/ scgid0471/ 
MKNRVFFKGNEGRAELHSMEIAATEPPTPPDPEGGAASSADSPGHESRCLGTFQRFAAQFGEDIPQSDMTYYAAQGCASKGWYSGIVSWCILLLSTFSRTLFLLACVHPVLTVCSVDLVGYFHAHSCHSYPGLLSSNLFFLLSLCLSL